MSLRIFVFIGYGADPSCLGTKAFRQIRSWPDTELVASSQLPASFTSSNFDVAIFPGGDDETQAKTLGAAGAKAVKDFVRSGGGFVGICAGAFLGGKGAPNASPWTLGLLDAEFWDQLTHAPQDIKGTVYMHPTTADELEPKKEPTLAHQASPGVDAVSGSLHVLLEDVVDAEDEAFGCLFHNGSCFLSEKCGPDVCCVATIGGCPRHFPRAIAGTVGIVCGNYGTGKVVLCGPHPEQTDGLEQLVCNMIRWAIPASGDGEEEASTEGLESDED